MKIYNKKGFAQGMLLGGLSAGLLWLCFTDGLRLKNIVLAVFLGTFAFYFLSRSLSHEKSREDLLEEREERNRLILLKSNSRAHQLTQIGSGIIMILLLAIGRVSGSREMIAVGLGAAFCFTISLFAELFTKMYYEKRN